MKLTHHIKNIFKKPQIWYGNFCLSKTGTLSRIHRRKISCILALCLLPLSISCTDDNFADLSRGDRPSYPEINLEDYRVVSLALNYGNSIGTRAVESDFQDGTTLDHMMDFTTPHESFALFFDENDMFMCVKQLQAPSSLGTGQHPEDGIGEWVRYAMSYVHKDTVPEKVLVVINGGRIYDELFSDATLQKYIKDLANLPFECDENGDPKLDEKGNFIYKKDENGNNIKGDITRTVDVNYFLNFEWKSVYSKNDGVIGKNDDGLFTMTNAAYYGPDDETKIESAPITDYKLQTVRKLDTELIKKTVANASNQSPQKSAATVYIERMVAKFSPPKFPTGVIGSDDKVIYPSQDAYPVSIYTWNKNSKTWRSENTKWRVHVLGWTINGREKSNFLFKHIKNGWEKEIKGWGKNYTNNERDPWNDPAHRRSYWSLDPHYDLHNYETDQTKEDFYPWQYRQTIDSDRISWVTPGHENEEDPNIALRYLTFNEVSYWNEDALTISENTFNPYDNDKSIINKVNYLDSRAALLMGPHLLITSELFLENNVSNGNTFLSKFSTVENLYCDRYYRYFLTEAEMFRMFVKDINDALKTQKTMTFKYYRWETEEEGIANPDKFEAIPEGNVQLLFDLTLDETSEGSYKSEFWKKMSETEQDIYRNLKELDQEYFETTGNGKTHKYHLRDVADVIDDLENDQIPMSFEANIKDGDSRIIPWIPGLVFRNVDNNNKREQILPVKNAVTGESYEKWTDNMRKSLIFERFGPIDHYYKGYMYYAAEIPHHIINSETKEGYYGAVRNHWYTFTVTSINALGTPVDNPGQKIIPGKYKHRDQISVYCEPGKWHFLGQVAVGFN